VIQLTSAVAVHAHSAEVAIAALSDPPFEPMF
jgi:hypothetical protein